MGAPSLDAEDFYMVGGNSGYIAQGFNPQSCRGLLVQSRHSSTYPRGMYGSVKAQGVQW
jgi:hypothetical protein